MRRPAKVLAWTLGGLLSLLAFLIAVVLVGANIQPGRDLIERVVPKLTGGDVRLQGLGGFFPSTLSAARVEIQDREGTWLVVDRFVLDWSPWRLLLGEAYIDRLAAARIEMRRWLIPSSESSSFSLPLQVSLQSLQVPRLQVGPAVAGIEAVFSIEGHAHLSSLTEGSLVLDVRGLQNAGAYRLEGSVTAKTLDAKLNALVPSDGLLARAAGLTNIGAITLDASFQGPRSAVATHVALEAGPLKAGAKGMLDLVKDAADLEVHASAPAMSPRADLVWQSLSLDATLRGPFVRPLAKGTLRAADLRAGGAEVRSIAADIQGESGQLRLDASLNGLRIPGRRPDALAGAPLVIKAEARLDRPDRPVTFTVTHPLIMANGELLTAKERKAKITLKLPDLAPLAAVAGTRLDGHSELHLLATDRAGTTTLDADATLSITGGVQPLRGLLGDSARITLAAARRGQDLTLSRLQVDGKTVRLSAAGRLSPQAVNLRWRAALSELSVLSPNVSGALQLKGQVEGPEDDLAVKADLSGRLAARHLPAGPITAHLEAKGLPKAPSGDLTAQGTLAESPLQVTLSARRTPGGESQVDIKHLDWKSAHGEGRLTLPAGAFFPVGTLELGMKRLQDLQPLLEKPLTGSFTAKLTTTKKGNVTQARATVEARAAGLRGSGFVDHLSLAATVLSPDTRPVVDATLIADGLSAKGFAGSGRLAVKGPEDALAFQLTANAQNLKGSPAGLNASAVLNAPKKKVDLSVLAATWKGEKLRLLSPAEVVFAKGLSVNNLRLGLREALLEVSGRLSPTLDLTAHVRNLSPDVAAAIVPDLNAQGTIRADAKLTGTLARPDGTVQVDAKGLRMRSGPGSSLPAANFTAKADLAGETARVDARLTVGPKTHLTLAGQAAVAAAGRMDLRAGGELDLALSDPILAAAGRRLRGQVQLNAGVAGTLAHPSLSGTVRLVRGEVQDYAQGVHLRDVSAVLDLQGDTVRITSFSARAGSGTLSASGTLGLLAPDVPVDLRVGASRARLLSSDLITVNLNANVTVTGQAAKQFLLAGDIHVNKAEIRIPETLPTSVATLNVERPGQKPPQPAPPGPTINLDLTVEAPRQIFVRGRGLDAELGGHVRVRGTAKNPEPLGSFHLLRGQFSMAGQTLTFSTGEVSFNGGSLTDPSLDFTVTTTNGTTTADLNIAGTVSNPKITLSSTPTLPQDEVMSQLLFHRSASSLSPFELAEIASAVAQLTGVTSGGMNPLGKIRKGLGLDQLAVGTSASGEPTLEAGRYVTPGVYVGVEQGTAAGSTKAKVQVDLTKHLKLEGTVGTNSSSATGAAGEGGSSVGITYQLEY